MINLNFPNEVRNESDFWGRQSELERIERTLLATDRKPVTVLGERRIGKTSLLNISIKRGVAKSSGRIVPLVIPSSFTQVIHSLEDYTTEILRVVCGHLGRSLDETRPITEGKGQDQTVPSRIARIVDTIAQLLKNAPDAAFILCIDEFDNILVNCVGKEAEARSVLALTDEIMQSPGLPLSLYLVMTRLPEELRASFSSPFITKSEVVELGPFPRTEMEEMVVGLLADHVVLDDQVMERLFHLSGGHPYFVKLLLDRLLARHWRAEGTLSVSLATLDDIIPDAVRDSRVLPALDNIYNVHFSPEEQALVLLLAERRGKMKGDELRALGAPYQKAARVLARRGYLTWDERVGCGFRIELLGWWLRDWEEYEVEKERLKVETLQKRKLDVDIQINRDTRQVYVKGVLLDVSLNRQEYQVLVLLCKHSGLVVARDMLAQELWPDAAKDFKGPDAAMDQIIHRLRGKLGDNEQSHIKTIRGQGFTLEGAAFIV
jgi:DNA-binding winged helix-turn-helix (wHTH) protein